MSAEGGPDWSGAVAEAAWIGERLTFESSVVTSVVPGGFEAYARVLHPAEEPSWGTRLVRWAEVAAYRPADRGGPAAGRPAAGPAARRRPQRPAGAPAAP